MLMGWMLALHCWSEEVMQYRPTDGDQLPHLKTGLLVTLMVVLVPSLLAEAKVIVPIVLLKRALMGVFLLIWELHFQLSNVKLLV